MTERQSVSITAIQSALLRLYQVAASKSANLMMYTSALGAIALATNQELPPALATIAGGVGFNILSNIIERVARGDNIADNEILEALEQSVEKSNIQQSLNDNEVQRGIGKLLRRHDQIIYAVNQSEYKIAGLLTEQYHSYQIIAEELHDDLLQLSRKLDKVATHEQNAEALKLLQKIEHLIEQKNEAPPPKLNLSLVNATGRGRFLTDELEFTQVNSRQLLPFGLGLTNVEPKSAPAEKLNITIAIRWAGNIEIKYVQIRVDSKAEREGWKVQRPELINEQTALLTYSGPEYVRCPAEHQLVWDRFQLYIVGHFQGTFGLDYSVTSAKPLSTNNGHLGIIVRQPS